MFTPQNILIIVVIIALVIAICYVLFRPKTTAATIAPTAVAATLPANSASTLPLQLQAYERLVILAERIGLRNLIGRVPSDKLPVLHFQAILVDNIKTEFEYNVSQQIYVSPQAWDALLNLKEQNIFLINQLGSFLAPDAPAIELTKAIAEYLSTNENASLQQIVMDALNYEAKALMR